MDMKKILVLIFTVLVTFSCTELTDLNINKKDPSAVPGESLFTGAQKNIVDLMSTCNVNSNIWELIMQYWTEVTYLDESNYDLVTRSIPDNVWLVCYRDVLKDFKESARIIGEPTYTITLQQKEQTNKLAIIEIMSVYTWAELIETFGDVPYTDALDITKLLPAYDDAETTYRALIVRLTAAIGNLDDNYGSFGDGDNIYQGDVAKWKKFGNSLKLRMGMLFADLDNPYAQATVEAAVTGGVFTSNDDNAYFTYGAVQPNTNPLYVNLVASGRYDFVATSTIVNAMNTLNDPRRQFYFSAYPTLGSYLGGPNAIGCTYASYSNQAEAIKQPTFQGNIFDYAQVEFLLAEARERTYAVGGTAESHYDNAIEASISAWGGTQTAVDDYLAQASVAYTTAAGTWRDKIGTQQWIAFYLRGFDAWTTQRRLNVPVLVVPPDAGTGFPVRYTYPIGEQTLNGANYDAAAIAVGGDAVETRLFFDVYGHP
jgi:hypothetical protein